MMESFRDLIAYQKAYQGSLEIHKLSLKFPEFEQHELGRQVRRATKSAAFNIAEGFGKKLDSINEFRRFLSVSLGSCDEVRVALDYCKDLGYISESEYSRLQDEYIQIGKLLISMKNKWK